MFNTFPEFYLFFYLFIMKYSKDCKMCKFLFFECRQNSNKFQIFCILKIILVHLIYSDFQLNLVYLEDFFLFYQKLRTYLDSNIFRQYIILIFVSEKLILSSLFCYSIKKTCKKGRKSDIIMHFELFKAELDKKYAKIAFLCISCKIAFGGSDMF